MDAVILPPRQADQPIPALTLPRLQHIERSEKANEVNFVLLPSWAIAAIAWRMPRIARCITGPDLMAIIGLP